MDGATGATKVAGGFAQRSQMIYRLDQHVFDFSKQARIVGVINLSTDSQYPESVASSTAEALRKSIALVNAGADIIEFGTESTRYHATRRSIGEQLDLLEPLLAQRAEIGVPLAVEASSARVFAQAAVLGARVFNLTGYDELDDIASIARTHFATIVVPFISGSDVHKHAELRVEGVYDRMTAFFVDKIERIHAGGMVQTVIDPGLGFYFPVVGGAQARIRYQLETYLHLNRLRVMGLPILATLVQASSVFEGGFRRLAEPVLSTLALTGGADLVRTHEVAAVERVRALLSHIDISRYCPDAT